jgi:hypothetical protein
MTSFSERLGITPPKIIQIANLDMELRNSLWNVCYYFWFTHRTNQLIDDPMYELAKSIYEDHYKLPVNPHYAAL